MEDSITKFLINNYDKADLTEKLYTSTHNKGLTQHIKSMEDDMRKYNIKPVLITLLHDPNYILKGTAWASINEDRDKILESLREDKTISYAISSIEVHPGKSQTLNKDERDKLNKSINESVDITKTLGTKRSNTKDTKDKNKAKLRKTIPKNITKLIEEGTNIIDGLREKKIVSLESIHSALSSNLRHFWTDKGSQEWKKRSNTEKVRLILSLLENIGSDNELYRYMINLYQKASTDDKLEFKYVKIIDRYDFLKQDILTLRGYPHIHIAIGLVSKDGEYTLCSDIYTKLAKMNLFDDIRVDEKKDNKKAYLNSINCVLKIDRFAGVKSIINTSIIRGYVGTDDANIIDKMKGIGSK